MKLVIPFVILALTLTTTLYGQGETVTGKLGGGLKVQDPVPLDGPVPALLRTVKVGDQALLQIRYESRPVFPREVTAKVGSRAMSALQVVTSQNCLFQLANAESATGVPGSYFGVLVRANSSGMCPVTVTATMSDGSQRTVTFQFQIDGGDRNTSDDAGRSSLEACVGKYSAQQVPGAVLIFATGAHSTAGYKVLFEELPIDVYPPEFRLVHEKPAGQAAQVVTPFSVNASFRAAKKIDQVYVHDAKGRHAVKVEQVPELAH